MEGRQLHEHPSDATFADDAIYMLVVRNINVLGQISDATGCVVRASAKRGMEMHFGKGKTEGMLRLVGPHSQAARKDIMAEGKALVDIEGTGTSLRIVKQYQHLGSIQADGHYQ